MSAPVPSNQASATAVSNYFVDEKKGEVSELKQVCSIIMLFDNYTLTTLSSC